jgi:hypothetical protein
LLLFDLTTKIGGGRQNQLARAWTIEDQYSKWNNKHQDTTHDVSPHHDDEDSKKS